MASTAVCKCASSEKRGNLRRSSKYLAIARIPSNDRLMTFRSIMDDRSVSSELCSRVFKNECDIYFFIGLKHLWSKLEQMNQEVTKKGQKIIHNPAITELDHEAGVLGEGSVVFCLTQNHTT